MQNKTLKKSKKTYNKYNKNKKNNHNNNHTNHINHTKKNVKSKHIIKRKRKLNRNTLKIQKGGDIGIFDKTNGAMKVAAYIYTRDKDNCDYYFGFVRKLVNGGRIRFSPGSATGAAGTSAEYMGKWTSVGGSTKTGITYLQAVIDELNHETNSNFNSKNDVDLSRINYKYQPINLNSKLILHKFYNNGKTLIFIFEIPDTSEFYEVFPAAGNTNPDLLSTSGGEIDAIISYNMDDIIEKQGNEIANYNNNYFIYYCINNFTKYVLPFICTLSFNFETDYKGTNINCPKDMSERKPIELPHNPYRETTPGKYIV